MSLRDTPEFNLGGGDLYAALYHKGPQYLAGENGTLDAQINSSLADFSGQFRNLVGRDPTHEERGAYLSNLVSNSGLDAFTGNRGLELSQLTGNYIGNQYKDESDRITGEKLAGQQNEANRLGELFRTQGNESINNVEQSLIDFNDRLQTRIRPNLITSLAAQGLLNTGGLNQAIAGQQADFANESSRQIADLRYQNDQGANAIAFGGASAPYNYQMAQLQNQPAYLQNAAQTGLQNSYNTMTNQLNFNNQAKLNEQRYYQQAALQAKNTHGFWGSVGNAFAPALGSALTNMVGSYGQTNAKTGQSGTGLGSLLVAG